MTEKNFETVGELAEIVHSRMVGLREECPSQESLQNLFQILYYASLRQEESANLLFDVIVLDPLNPDPYPPGREMYDRATAYPFSIRLEANIATITKVARASDPRASSFALYHSKKAGWYVWGMIDQGNQYYSHLNHASEIGRSRPGLFQVSIAGVGHLIVYHDFAKLAELRIDRIVSRTHDVFWRGPIREKLLPGINSYISNVASTVGTTKFNERGHWNASLSSYWISSLCSLILRVQGLRHGGALLFAPGIKGGLNIKYQLDYDRLQQALFRRAVLHILHTEVSDRIFEEVFDTNSDEVPVDYYLDESISGTHIEENDREMNGALWFIAYLSRVDGLIVMDNTLKVLGFGAEITINEIPPTIIRAKSRLGGTKGGLRLNYEHFGTRHRSMMRYIAQNPESVGFVVSQDHEVRVMTQVNGRVVVWDDLRLQVQSPARRRRKARSIDEIELPWDEDGTHK